MRVATGHSEDGGAPDPQKLFAQARIVAGTGQFDYAIELHLRGLAMAPGDLEGYRSLYEVAFRRKAAGKPPLGMLESMKARRGVTLEDRLRGVLKLVAYDPGNEDHTMRLLKIAHEEGFDEVAQWIRRRAERMWPPRE